MNISYFILETGEIIRINDVAEDSEIPMNQPEGCSFVQGEYDPEDWYVEPILQAPTARPMVPDMYISTYDLNLLPVGATLTITDENGFETVIPAQDDTLELTDAGAYKVHSDSPFPHIDFNVEVIVP